MMEQPVTTVEMQSLPSFAAELPATRRQRVKRFLAKNGKRGQRQLEFSDLIERLPTEDDRVALIGQFDSLGHRYSAEVCGLAAFGDCLDDPRRQKREPHHAPHVTGRKILQQALKGGPLIVANPKTPDFSAHLEF